MNWPTDRRSQCNMETFNDLVGIRSRDLPACSIEPHPNNSDSVQLNDLNELCHACVSVWWRLEAYTKGIKHKLPGLKRHWEWIPDERAQCRPQVWKQPFHIITKDPQNLLPLPHSLLLTPIVCFECETENVNIIFTAIPSHHYNDCLITNQLLLLRL
jgi:hypothetical protein